MKSIEELKAAQARELADLEKQHAIAALLPLAGASHISPSLSTGTPWVSFKVVGIRGALAVLPLFTIVPFTEYRDGSLSLKPRAFVPEAKQGDLCDNWAASLKVDTRFGSHLGTSVTAKITFFARIPGLDIAQGVVRVSLDIQGPEYIGNYTRLGANCRIHAGRVVRGSIRGNNALHGHCHKTITWAAGSDSSASYEYLISADYADQDATSDEFKELLNVLQNIADEFEPVKEAE